MDQEGLNGDDCPLCGDGEEAECDPDDELAYCPSCNVRYMPGADPHSDLMDRRWRR